MSEIHDLNLTDTEYAALAAKDYNPQLEQLMIESPEQARKLTRLVGLTKDKPPQTEEEWAEFMSIWEGDG